MAFKRTSEEFGKILAERERTPFEKWLLQLVKKCGQEVIDYIYAYFYLPYPKNAKEKVFYKYLRPFLEMYQKRQIDHKSAQYLSQKSFAPVVDAISDYITANFYTSKTQSYKSFFER